MQFLVILSARICRLLLGIFIPLSKIQPNLRISKEIKLPTPLKNWYFSTLFHSSLKSQLILPLKLRGETQRRHFPRTKNFFACGGYYSYAVFLPQKTTICIQRHRLSIDFWYGYGFARLCCYCQYGYGRRGTKGLSHFTG